jgi:peptidylprolyl isomerase
VPQSRHRKTKKKRQKGLYPTASAGARGGKSRNTRAIAIGLVVILAAGVAAYVFMNRRGGSAGTEVTTASGLKYTDLVEGTGASPQIGQSVTVHYTGTLENGTKFDSSYDRGQPMTFRFGLDPMIKGWDEGVSTMKVGGKRKLIVPPALGYGVRGKPPDIPGNAILVFEIEMLAVK